MCATSNHRTSCRFKTDFRARKGVQLSLHNSVIVLWVSHTFVVLFIFNRYKSFSLFIYLQDTVRRADYQQLQDEVHQLRVSLKAANVAHAVKQRDLTDRLSTALHNASVIESQLAEVRQNEEQVGRIFNYGKGVCVGRGGGVGINPALLKTVVFEILDYIINSKTEIEKYSHEVWIQQLH